MSLRRTLTYGLLLVALILGRAGAAHAAQPRLIRDLTAAASLIVIGQIKGTTDFAEGAFSIAALDVLDTLKGPALRKLSIVEERKSSLHLYQKGQRVLVFLDRAPTHSLYSQHLPAGKYFAAVGGKEGVIELERRADGTARFLIQAYSEEEPEEVDARELVRRELRSGQSRFVADAVSQLRVQPGLARSFEQEDLSAVKACLHDGRVDDRTRASLVRLLGEQEVRAALPALRALEPSSGVLIVARARALADLGYPPASAEMDAYLRHPDPEVRRFALDQLASSPAEDAVRQLEAVALNDHDKKVRVAAIEALGATGRPEVTEVLERTFNSEDSELRRASARAFHELGGPAAQQALSDLVFHGERYEVQAHALVLLFALGATRQDPVIERIQSEHPDKRIRQIIDEGIDFRAPSDPHRR